MTIATKASARYPDGTYSTKLVRGSFFETFREIAVGDLVELLLKLLVFESVLY